MLHQCFRRSSSISYLVSRGCNRAFFSTVSLRLMLAKRERISLELKNGPTFFGESFGASIPGSGEVVFSTGLVGYPESMTDPSYRGQILVFTQPLIGNYGVPSDEKDEYGLEKFWESSSVHVSGIVVSNYAEHYSHWNAKESLSNWCKRFNIPAITGVDTRALTKYLRHQGASLGRFILPDQPKLEFSNPNQRNLVEEVTTKEVKIYNEDGDVTIALLDCGTKNNIIRCLVERGARVKLVPYNYDRILEEHYDGLFVSNGPGDPAMCAPTVEILKKAFQDDIPIFGICMGNLLMGMAAGAPSYKLKFGNRGHNQPAINEISGKGIITSQNHGYAIDTSKLPPQWKPFYTNVNDQSNEGLYHTEKPFYSVQFHPEYQGGPQDASFLFDSFLTQVRNFKSTHLRHRSSNLGTTSNNMKTTTKVFA